MSSYIYLTYIKHDSYTECMYNATHTYQVNAAGLVCLAIDSDQSYTELIGRARANHER